MALTRKRKIFLLWWYRRKALASKRRRWIHPICKDRGALGEFKLLPQIFVDDEKCLEYFRMTPTTFQSLLVLCANGLQKQNTNWRKSITPMERLVVTLRYLATGNSFRSLAFSFRLGASTVQIIVRCTCNVLWRILQPIFMAEPSIAMWKKSSDDFFSKWNFPNCVRAIGGTHIRLKKPALSGATYWNYKGYCSVILLAVVDANGRFLVIDIGSYGGCSDGDIFRESHFGKLLIERKLHLPAPLRIPQTEQLVPPVFVADEAFPLLINLMKPFPRRNLTFDQRVFIYRLSRARRQVECSFGVLKNTWRILLKGIETNTVTAIGSAKAACVLHNFLLAHEPERIKTPDSECSMDRDDIVFASTRTASQEANATRNTLCNYFVSPSGSLPWQNEACLNNI